MTIPQIPQLVYAHCEGRDTLPNAVRAYGQACYRAGMEFAAQQVDALAREAWERGASRECTGLEMLAINLRADAGKEPK